MTSDRNTAGLVLFDASALVRLLLEDVGVERVKTKLDDLVEAEAEFGVLVHTRASAGP